MRLHVIDSGSKANGYVLTNDQDTLIIEAGCNYRSVCTIIDYNVESIRGCVVSHSHYDHSRHVVEYVKRGVKVLALEQVFEYLYIKGKYCINVTPLKGYKLGDFKIMPFEVHHDIPCLGYIIDHPDMGRLLFYTDTYMLKYKFEGINHLLMEINYSEEIARHNVESGLRPQFVHDRLLTSHMELGEAKEMLKSNNLSAVRNIVLCHLSDENSNEELFIDQVAALTGKPVYVAKPGLEVDLSSI